MWRTRVLASQRRVGSDSLTKWCDVQPALISEMDKLFRSFSQIDESITRSFGGSGKPN